MGRYFEGEMKEKQDILALEKQKESKFRILYSCTFSCLAYIKTFNSKTVLGQKA